MKAAADLRERAAAKLEIRAAKAAARRAERAAQRDEQQADRARQVEARRLARRVRAEQRAEWAAAIAQTGRRLRPVAPLVVVTGFAMYGQIGYGFEHYTTADTPEPLRFLVAIGAAVAVESIALYVAWHAHDALLNKATATAARLRRASYGIALAVAGVNYAHFADGWTPTAGAVVFGIFSAAGPWLWGLHTRRAQHMQLLREGQADTTGAVFSAERFRAFPLRTIKARRYSIDHGITDPQVAWEAYRLEMQRRRDDLPAAWRQMALGLLRLDRAQDHAEWAANMVSPVDAPELERVEDVIEPDLDKVDDIGLSLLWKTAPRVSVSAATPKPQRASSRPPVPLPDVDMERARELRANGAGRVQFEREFGLNEYWARELVKAVDSRPSPSSNGHKVGAS
jgi:hypothetical protein